MTDQVSPRHRETVEPGQRVIPRCSQTTPPLLSQVIFANRRALQLAIALEMLESSWISVMLSADKRLCEGAEACGSPAIDLAQPGLIQG